jgi:TonB family protein
MKQGLDIATKALALCAGAFLFGSAALAKDEPLALKQSDKWVANFDTESCQLITVFGEGDKKVLVRFSRYTPGDTFALDLFGKPFWSDANHNKVSIQFGPNGSLSERSSTNGKNGKMPMMMLGYADFLGRKWDAATPNPPVTPADESAIRWLDVKVVGRKPLRLETGSMGRPMQVMRACIVDLYKSWGFDLEAMNTYRRSATPLGSPGNWLRSDDYPSAMVRAGGQGLVRFRLTVDEAGNVSSCHIQQRTNPDEFADLSCKLITKRAKFSPALDASGKPVASLYTNMVRWTMEGS